VRLLTRADVVAGEDQLLEREPKPHTPTLGRTCLRTRGRRTRKCALAWFAVNER
jgi:hypothetical protein